MKAQSALPIGRLAEQSGTTAKTVRFYEQAGLIPPAERAENGYRTYSQADVERLRFIRAARTLGFSLDDLRDILALRDHGERPCQQVMELLQSRLSDIDAQIEQLRALRREMRVLIQVAEALSLRPADDEPCVCDLIGDVSILPPRRRSCLT
jgi:DNA-binding transcriptional MerR regulator